MKRAPRPRREKPELLPPSVFMARAAGYGLFGIGGISFCLLLGTWGYHRIAGLGWVDSFFNASMILSGMGPASEMPNVEAKIFASLYALAGGLAWTTLLGVIVYPFVHRMLHALHLQMKEEDD